MMICNILLFYLVNLKVIITHNGFTVEGTSRQMDGKPEIDGVHT